MLPLARPRTSQTVSKTVIDRFVSFMREAYCPAVTFDDIATALIEAVQVACPDLRVTVTLEDGRELAGTVGATTPRASSTRPGPVTAVAQGARDARAAVALASTGAPATDEYPIRYAGARLGALRVAGATASASFEERFFELLARELAFLRVRYQGLAAARRAFSRDDLLVGWSSPLRRLESDIEKVAGWNHPVMVIAEPGTEIAAVVATIHGASAHASGPLVRFRCGADGQRRPADAVEKAAERATGGTLFLEGVEQLDRDVGRRLQGLAVRGTDGIGDWRAGEDLAFRLVASTSCAPATALPTDNGLDESAALLDVLRITIPPLRVRTDDIGYWLEVFCRRLDGEPSCFSPEVLAALRAYRWSGNSQELERVATRLMVMRAQATITLDDVQAYAPDVIGDEDETPSIGRRAADAVATRPLRVDGSQLAGAARLEPGGGPGTVSPGRPACAVLHRQAVHRGDHAQPARPQGVRQPVPPVASL